MLVTLDAAMPPIATEPDIMLILVVLAMIAAAALVAAKVIGAGAKKNTGTYEKKEVQDNEHDDTEDA